MEQYFIVDVCYRFPPLLPKLIRESCVLILILLRLKDLFNILHSWAALKCSWQNSHTLLKRL